MMKSSKGVHGASAVTSTVTGLSPSKRSTGSEKPFAVNTTKNNHDTERPTKRDGESSLCIPDSKLMKDGNHTVNVKRRDNRPTYHTQKRPEAPACTQRQCERDSVTERG